MFGRSRSDAIPSTRQAIGTKKTMITVFFTASIGMVPDILPQGRNFNQLYFVHSIFPDLKGENMRYGRRTAGSTFWVHIDNSMYHNGSKIEPKFRTHHLFRMPHPPYWPDISPCQFRLFGILKGILKDRELTSSDEIKEAIPNVWNDLTFHDVQSVFRNWMSRLSWVIENGGEYVHE
jgi:hypothetical protein